MKYLLSVAVLVITAAAIAVGLMPAMANAADAAEADSLDRSYWYWTGHVRINATKFNWIGDFISTTPKLADRDSVLPRRIDSEHSDWSNAEPLPIPRWKPPIDSTFKNNRIIQHSAHSNLEVTLPFPTIREANRQMLVPGFSEEIGNTDPELNNEGAQGGDKNFGSLQLVSNPENFPWRVNVKLKMRWGSSWYVGSGVLVGPRHILTAGHCVYDVEHGWGWADEVIAIPGYENGSEPHGRGYNETMSTWTAWTQNGDFAWDIAIVSLDSYLGNQVNYHGYGYNNDNGYFSSNTFNNPGYPAASPYNGEFMYTWSGTYDSVITQLLYFEQISYGGQSGSGSYTFIGGARYVFGIASHYTWFTPPVPDWVNATDNYCDRIVVTWQNVDHEDGYGVYRDGAVFAYTGPDDCSVTDYTNPGTYTYYVRSYNSAGESNLGGPDQGTRLAVPQQVTGVIASNGTYCDRVVISWNDVSGETGYKIYRNGSYIGSVGANVTTYSDYGGSCNVSYDYAVRAYNLCGDGPMSSSNSGWSICEPGQVTGVSATDDHVDDVVITWSDVSSETGYRVYRNGTQIGGDRPANSTQYTDVPAVGCYSYTVRAFNACGEGPLSDADEGCRIAAGPRAWYVSTTGSDVTGDGSAGNPFETIQHAVDMTVDDDTISVADGTYYENVIVWTSLTIIGANKETTVIDGSAGGEEPNLRLHGSSGRLSGFSITSSLTAGIQVFNNWLIADNIVSGNAWQGVSIVNNATVERNVVEYNNEGVRTYAGAAPQILQNVIVNNGRGIVGDPGTTSMDIRNNIIISSTGDYGIWIRDAATLCLIDYNDVWNNSLNYGGCTAGSHDISAEPLFVGGNPYDYHLQCASPCIDAGDPSLPNDADGTIADMGVYFFDQSDESDDDGDGIVDCRDNCPTVYNPDQADADGDGEGDECDTCTDTDGDGYGNPGYSANTCPDDNCPDHYNPTQADLDADGIGDSCDTCTDTDGDGYGNPGFAANTCSEDNCPFVYNPDQADADADGTGDACEVGTSITLDAVAGLTGNDTISSMHEITFYLRVTNIEPNDFRGITNGFRVYSPDGATWSATVPDTLGSIDWESNFMFFYPIEINVDGMDADTVGFGGVGTGIPPSIGIPAFFDDTAFSITIGPIASSHEGRTVCLDSCWYPPTGVWKWDGGSGIGYRYPAWDGPYCFVVGHGTCCILPIRGNVDYDPGDEIDISDLVYLVDYMFSGGPEPPCWPEGNIDGNGPDDNSGIDISDLVYLVDYMFTGGPAPVECP